MYRTGVALGIITALLVINTECMPTYEIEALQADPSKEDLQKKLVDIKGKVADAVTKLQILGRNKEDSSIAFRRQQVAKIDDQHKAYDSQIQEIKKKLGTFDCVDCQNKENIFTKDDSSSNKQRLYGIFDTYDEACLSAISDGLKLLTSKNNDLKVIGDDLDKCAASDHKCLNVIDAELSKYESNLIQILDQANSLIANAASTVEDSIQKINDKIRQEGEDATTCLATLETARQEVDDLTQSSKSIEAALKKQNVAAEETIKVILVALKYALQDRLSPYIKLIVDFKKKATDGGIDVKACGDETDLTRLIDDSVDKFISNKTDAFTNDVKAIITTAITDIEKIVDSTGTLDKLRKCSDDTCITDVVIDIEAKKKSKSARRQTAMDDITTKQAKLGVDETDTVKQFESDAKTKTTEITGCIADKMAGNKKQDLLNQAARLLQVLDTAKGTLDVTKSAGGTKDKDFKYTSKQLLASFDKLKNDINNEEDKLQDFKNAFCVQIRDEFSEAYKKRDEINQKLAKFEQYYAKSTSDLENEIGTDKTNLRVIKHNINACKDDDTSCLTENENKLIQYKDIEENMKLKNVEVKEIINLLSYEVEQAIKGISSAIASKGHLTINCLRKLSDTRDIINRYISTVKKTIADSKKQLKSDKNRVETFVKGTEDQLATELNDAIGKLTKEITGAQKIASENKQDYSKCEGEKVLIKLEVDTVSGFKETVTYPFKTKAEKDIDAASDPVMKETFDGKLFLDLLKACKDLACMDALVTDSKGKADEEEEKVTYELSEAKAKIKALDLAKKESVIDSDEKSATKIFTEEATSKSKNILNCIRTSPTLISSQVNINASCTLCSIIFLN